MNLRLLISAALLLTSFALAQQSPEPVTPPPAKPGAATAQMQVECTPAAHAAGLIGQYGCVAGKVSRVTVGKNGNTHLTICSAHSKCKFQAVVRSHDSSKVGDLSYLRGRIVAVEGDVTEYRGNPRIAIKRRQQLHIAASDAPSQLEADQNQPAVNAQSPHGSKRNRAW